jgi:hypothetical protein
MARGSGNEAINSLKAEMTDRSKFALEVAKLCFVARDQVAHPDRLYVAYCMTLGWSQLTSGQVKLDSAESYTRFINLCCDYWQIMLYGLL